MNRLKVVFLCWAAIFGLLALVGLLLPDHAHLERTVTIQAPAQRVYEILSDFRYFGEWSPWEKRDIDTKFKLEGPSSGVGARMLWVSKDANVGKGAQEIIAATPPSYLQIRMDFAGQQNAITAFHLAPKGEQATEVTWSFDTDFDGNLVGRYMGLVFDSLLGPDYAAGLQHLKAFAERPDAPVASSLPSQ